MLEELFDWAENLYLVQDSLSMLPWCSQIVQMMRIHFPEVSESPENFLLHKQ